MRQKREAEKLGIDLILADGKKRSSDTALSGRELCCAGL